MNLVDQYLRVIGQKLPAGNRADIEAELRSYLLDDIEETYGPNPNETQIKEALKKFGSPAAVARRYRVDHPVIGKGLEPLYYFVLKVTLGAIALAFAVVSILAAIRGPREATDIARLVGSFFSNTVTAWLAAVGAVTLGFMVATRFKPEASVDLDSDWDPEELRSVVIEEAGPGKIESIITIAGSVLIIALMNGWPGIVTTAEDFFFGHTPFGNISHRVDIAALGAYIRALTVVWALAMAHGIACLAFPGKRKEIRAAGAAIDVCETVIFALMFFDAQLYSAYRGIVGFRLIFGIIAAAQGLSLLATFAKGLAERARRFID
jgi:hypothetical protein